MIYLIYSLLWHKRVIIWTASWHKPANLYAYAHGSLFTFCHYLLNALDKKNHSQRSIKYIGFS